MRPLAIILTSNPHELSVNMFFLQMQVSKTARKNSRWNNSGHGHTKSIQRPSLQPLYRDNLPCVSKLNSYGIVPSIQLPSLQKYQSHLNQLSYLLVDCEKMPLLVRHFIICVSSHETDWYMNACMHAYIYICIYIYVAMCVCMYVCMYVSIYLSIYLSI